MKKNNEKKDKIKKTVLKILHVVSYVLSFGFIIVCILVGVGSCNNKKSHVPQRQERQVQERINIEGQYKYFLAPNQSIVANFTNYDDTELELTLTEGCILLLSDSNSYGVSIYLGDNFVSYGNNLYEGKFNSLHFDFWWNAIDDKLDLSRMYLINYENGTTLEIFGWSTNWVYQPVSICANSLNIDSGSANYNPVGDFNVNNFLSLYFGVYENEYLQYYFDVNNINPIEFYSYELTAYNLVHNVGSWTGHIDLDMVFTSNGIVYDKMRFQYDYVLGCYVDGEVYTFDTMTYLGLTNIQYHNRVKNEWQVVCYPRIYKYETRTINNASNLYGYPMTDFKTYLWSNEGYKDINIVSGSKNVFTTLSADPLAYLTNWQILNYKGEYNNVYISGNGNTNVFALLGNAFNSVGGLFTIVLLPGITIGTLLFLPLVVLIIFAIIKIIHK